ncbi:hypothetical protein PBI_ROPE_13 [Mycobacterium phage Rope]|uniref:Uncharacterized protein n=5 Tax=Papyrusvirus TaxID=1982554 RepID=A0A2P1JQN9_9CAUD|nr:hypothetical protein FDI62_gp13 [Mycobacterium phage Send513]ARW57099.1 hypothetical protein SEA_ZENON_14 [Mycobacterium phage Zenon]AVO21412.1 hypothetical protein PBI_NILO_14 [Mycobacterium phage Nilo]QCG78120.1 hypothetical protein SEA_CANDLE_13 [Mycobacterium phage Candle]QNN99673.1 hypothetical protein PBI_ROPE_13 [Mycobacterium phage Rope]AEK07459.1 hypothetical protein SEND513_13 [Mycobacterium phage Send513]
MIPDNFDSRPAFNRALTNAKEHGRMCPFGIGLSTDTMQAINAVAKAYPSATDDLVAQAQNAFQREVEQEALGLQ